MKRIKYLFWILLILLCAFVSIKFYATKDFNSLEHALLVIENTVKTFFGNSPLTLSEIMSTKLSNNDLYDKVLVFIYAIVIYISPALLVASVITTFTSVKIKLYECIFKFSLKFKAVAFNYIYNKLSDSIYSILNGSTKSNCFFDFNVVNKLKQSLKKDATGKNTYDKKDMKCELTELGKKVFDYNTLKDYIKNSSESKLFDFIKIEHRRWNYSKAFTGFHFDLNGDKNKYQHKCLTTYDKLVENAPDTVLYDLIPMIYLLSDVG